MPETNSSIRIFINSGLSVLELCPAPSIYFKGIRGFRCHICIFPQWIHPSEWGFIAVSKCLSYSHNQPENIWDLIYFYKHSSCPIILSFIFKLTVKDFIHDPVSWSLSQKCNCLLSVTIFPFFPEHTVYQINKIFSNLFPVQ